MKKIFFVSIIIILISQEGDLDHLLMNYKKYLSENSSFVDDDQKVEFTQFKAFFFYKFNNFISMRNLFKEEFQKMLCKNGFQTTLDSKHLNFQENREAQLITNEMNTIYDENKQYEYFQAQQELISDIDELLTKNTNALGLDLFWKNQVDTYELNYLNNSNKVFNNKLNRQILSIRVAINQIINKKVEGSGDKFQNCLEQDGYWLDNCLTESIEFQTLLEQYTNYPKLKYKVVIEEDNCVNQNYPIQFCNKSNKQLSQLVLKYSEESQYQGMQKGDILEDIITKNDQKIKNINNWNQKEVDSIDDQPDLEMQFQSQTSKNRFCKAIKYRDQWYECKNYTLANELNNQCQFAVQNICKNISGIDTLVHTQDKKIKDYIESENDDQNLNFSQISKSNFKQKFTQQYQVNQYINKQINKNSKFFEVDQANMFMNMKFREIKDTYVKINDILQMPYLWIKSLDHIEYEGQINILQYWSLSIIELYSRTNSIIYNFNLILEQQIKGKYDWNDNISTEEKLTFGKAALQLAKSQVMNNVMSYFYELSQFNSKSTQLSIIQTQCENKYLNPQNNLVLPLSANFQNEYRSMKTILSNKSSLQNQIMDDLKSPLQINALIDSTDSLFDFYIDIMHQLYTSKWEMAFVSLLTSINTQIELLKMIVLSSQIQQSLVGSKTKEEMSRNLSLVENLLHESHIVDYLVINASTATTMKQLVDKYYDKPKYLDRMSFDTENLLNVIISVFTISLTSKDNTITTMIQLLGIELVTVELKFDRLFKKLDKFFDISKNGELRKMLDTFMLQTSNKYEYIFKKSIKESYFDNFEVKKLYTEEQNNIDSKKKKLVNELLKSNAMLNSFKQISKKVENLKIYQGKLKSQKILLDKLMKKQVRDWT